MKSDTDCTPSVKRSIVQISMLYATILCLENMLENPTISFRLRLKAQAPHHQRRLHSPSGR